MISYLLLIPLIASFFIVLFTIPVWIRKAKQINLLWEDMNKFRKEKNIAGSGGLIVLTAFVLSVLSYVAIRTFVFENIDLTIKIFALLSTVMIAGIIGFVDDIFGWAHGGLSARLRVFLVLIAAIPLMVINAGSSIVSVPFIGLVDFGLIYPLLIIPIGIIGATTAYNFLAGFNGLETGQGIIIISFLSLIAYMVGLNWLTLIGFCMVAGLIAFLIYNWFPARVFPGDVLTYSIGALIACLAILGNFEKLAVFIFIPYILEFFLKLRGGLKKSSFGKPQEDGSLELLHDKIYGLEHLAIYILKRAKPSRKVYEKDVVFLIFGFQIFVCLLGFLIFGGIL